MEKKVTNCGECLFCELSEMTLNYYCNHPDMAAFNRLNQYSENEIHPSCPEGQPFVIITSKIKEDE